MNFFSLFSGVGGFDLGLERAGWECVGQCEIDPFCLSILEKHWPTIWKHHDIRTLTGELVRANCGKIDALIGGPPCQPSSCAGKRRGADDDRWLWPEYLRLVSEINPMWLLAENPRGVFSLVIEGLQFNRWLGRQFEARGYDLIPIRLAAEDLGAPHRRERIWFVGHSHFERRSEIEAVSGWSEEYDPGGIRQEEKRNGLAHSQSLGERKLDNEEGSEPWPSPWESSVGRSNGDRESLGHSHIERLQEYPCEPGDSCEKFQTTVRKGGPLRWPARPGDPQWSWEEPRIIEIESQMGSSTDGISGGLAGSRMAMLKALGNAVVPQCAEVLGLMIRRFMEIKTTDLLPKSLQ